MQELIAELAKIIGIDPALIEGSGITLFAGAFFYLARIFLVHLKTDDKKVSFEQRLVDMAANAVEAYQKNTKAVEASTTVLVELVATVRELAVNLPLKMATHETTMLASFVDKADEMHKVVERRDMENEKDRKTRDENHQDVTQQLEVIKKEITDATDENTLRSAVSRIVDAVNRIITLLEETDKTEKKEDELR